MSARRPFLAALILAGCGTEVAPRPPEAILVAPPSSSVVDVPTPLSRERLVAHAACFGLSPCKVVAARAVSRSDGRETLLAIVARGIQGPEDSTEELPDVHEEDDGADVFSASYGACTEHEAWSIVVEGAEARRVALVARFCNDGHGAASVGEDRIEVKNGKIVHAESGGSNWRWSNVATASLDRGLERIEIDTWFALATATSRTTWDYAAFRGTAEAEGAVCGKREDETRTVEYAPIPRVSMDASFGDAAWATTRIDGCASTFDGTTSGYVIGKAGKPSASFRAVTAGNDLHVEVDDDDLRATKGGDRLEVYVRGTSLNYDPCWAPGTPAGGAVVDLQGFGVRTIGPTGGAKLPSVKGIVVGPGKARLTIRFVERPEGVSLVYRDIDANGRGVDVGTSPLSTNDALTVGDVFAVPDVTCRVDGNALRAHATSRDAPLTERPYVRAPR